MKDCGEDFRSDELLTRAEAAEFLRLSPATLAIWKSQGRVDAPPFRQHGRRIVYSVIDLKKWSEARKKN